jgi:negative regulator of sigma E activity
MNDQDLRDCFAMFALTGAIMSRDSWTPEKIWAIADDMVEARNKEPEHDGGITTIKKRKYVRKD